VDKTAQRALSEKEGIEFLKKVAQGKIEAIAFKEFPYFWKKVNMYTVEREIWYRDFEAQVETKKYVVVHIHFLDAYAFDKEDSKEMQSVTRIGQVRQHMRILGLSVEN
jgi:hypothetical protein